MLEPASTVGRMMRLLPVILLGLLSGCDQAAWINRFAPADEQASAKAYIDQLRQGKLDQIERDIDPQLRTPELHGTLEKMAGMMPSGAPDAVATVGANVVEINGSRKTNLTFEYRFGNKWVLVSVATEKKDQSPATIIGIHVQPLSDSLENINRFRLVGKTPVQYSVVALAVAVPLLTIYALVLCIRARVEGRKWLWIAFILFGVGQFGVNWTTGQWEFKTLAVQLFGASAYAPLYGPWTLSVSLPLGAIVFLISHSRWKRQRSQVQA